MNSLPKITIDPEFQNLIRPLRRKEYLLLEESIREEGCRDPIILWKGILIDGHNRYEICTRHAIPFQTREMEFSCREEVVAWICRNQLGRRNISEETRRYLIGRQYESEKIVNKIKNPLGRNQYSTDDDYIADEHPHRRGRKRHKTAQRIADENHITHATVQKYASFTRALDEIGRKEPELKSKILSGKYKISIPNIVKLSLSSAHELRKVNTRVERNKQAFLQYSETKDLLEHDMPRPVLPTTPAPSIKDMPEFDPDSTLVELSLTIPTWISSIKRMENNTNMEIVSDIAKGKLEDALLNLYSEVEKMLIKLKED